MRPYVRPFCATASLAIMGFRTRAGHQSTWRAQGTRNINGLARICFSYLSLSHHAFAATSCRISPAGLAPPIHRSIRECHTAALRLRLCRTARRTVDLVVRHQRPDDARRLVRQCDGRQSGWATLENAPEPCTSNAAPLPHDFEHGRGSQHQQPPYLRVASLGDTPQTRFPAGRMLPRHQTEPRAELPRILEQAEISDRRSD